MKAIRHLLVLAVVLAALVPLPAHAACKIAATTEGYRMLVGASGEPGMVLRVYWGDGEVTTTRAALGRDKSRLLVAHDYVAAGQYRITAELHSGEEQCSLSSETGVPHFEPDEDPGNDDLLPPNSAAAELDEADHENEATVQAHPGQRNRGGDPESGVFAGIGRALGDLFGGLFGRRR
jgi:hypothetical protein